MAEDSASDITLTPTPGFVIKSLIVSGGPRKQGVKTFINVCSDPQMPEPDIYGQEVVQRIRNGQDWTVPMVLSAPRDDIDKAGRKCLVWDCCIHPKVIIESIKSADIKLLLIETCLEAVEAKADVELSRDFSLPKMLSKGILQSFNLKAEELVAPEPHLDNVVAGMDKFAGEILGETPWNSSPNTDKVKTVAPAKSLIQEISSQDLEYEYKINRIVSPINGNLVQSEMKFSVSIADVADIDNFSINFQDKTLNVKTPTLISIDLPIEISGAKAFYVKNSRNLEIFVS